jgi:uncharacterized protein YkwD
LRFFFDGIRKRRAPLVSVAAVWLALFSFGAFDSPPPTEHHPPRIVARYGDAAALLATLNAERTAAGLAPLASDGRLRAIALEHAEDMAQRNYFSHTTPEGLNPLVRYERAHYAYSYLGENLALDSDVTSASAALWHSLEHRSNILQPHFLRVGVAAIWSPLGEIFVEDFSD